MRQIEARDVEVEMELLRTLRIWPVRRDVPLDGLEGQHLTGRRVKRCPAVADRPARIRLVDRAAQQSAVERRQYERLRAVQDDAFQRCDRIRVTWCCHGSIMPEAAPRPAAAQAAQRRAVIAPDAGDSYPGTMIYIMGNQAHTSK